MGLKEILTPPANIPNTPPMFPGFSPILRSAFLALVGLWLSCSAARAIDYVWTGNGVTDQYGYWWNPNNWSPTGIPGANDTATIGGPMSYSVSTETRTIRGITLLPGVVLDSSGSMTVTEVMNWQGGVLNGEWHIPATATMNISGPGDRTVGKNNGGYAVIQNSGRVVVTNDGDILSGEISNSGVFEVQNDRQFVGCWFFNNGVFRKTGGSGVTRFAYPSSFWNSKSIEISSGVVELNRSGWTNQHQFEKTSSVSGPGLLRITEPTFDPSVTPPYGTILDAKVLVYGLNIQPGAAVELGHGGLLSAGLNQFPHTEASVSGSGIFTWTGGKISNYLAGSGFLFEPGSNLLISGNEARTLDYSSRLLTQGNVTWTGAGAIQMDGGQWIHSGDFLAQGNGSATKTPLNWSNPPPAGVFENRGTFRKEGAGTTTFNQTQFSNYGTLEIVDGTLLFVMKVGAAFQHLDGTISLHDDTADGPGGVLALRDTNGARSGFALSKGSLLGPGTIDGGIGNVAGAVYPAYHRGGVLHVLGSYTQQPAGSLNLTIAGPSAADFTQMEVGGTFSPSGTVSIWLPDGYTPEVGQRFPIVNKPAATSVNSLQCATTNFAAEYGPEAFAVIATDKAPSSSKALQNISTRGVVGTGDNVLIGGWSSALLVRRFRN
jgi:hypothetical protein